VGFWLLFTRELIIFIQNLNPINRVQVKMIMEEKTLLLTPKDPIND